MSNVDYDDLKKAQRVHCIGVGGIGMSALARLLLHEKKQVSGSDRTETPLTQALQEEGVRMYEAQVRENITPDIEFIIYTGVMKQDSEEMLAARELDVPMLCYTEALALIANEYYLVAVAGTHGKTTTTAMLIDIFEEASLDPTGVVGSLRIRTRSNFRAGKSKYFIVEACEYMEHFLSFTPDILVITNIEYDHVDYFKDLAAVQKVFEKLSQNVRAGGAIIANLSDPQVHPVVKFPQDGPGGIKVVDYGEYLDPLLQLTLPGLHNQMNAAAASAAAACIGIEEKVIKETLEQYAGTWRRFEYKGELGGAKVHDDYAHHPTAIRATISAARELYPDRNVTAVFQPHTYTRTHELFDDFAEALAKADRIVLLPIYAAREKNDSGVTSEKLVEKIKETNDTALYFDTFASAEDHIRASASGDDIILIMGAGDITSLTDKITINS